LKINMKTIYIIIILLSPIYTNGIFSNGFEKSINFSISYKSDNDNFYIEDDNEPITKELKPKVYNAVLNMVFKGKYEIGYEYLYNSSFVNGYNLPERGSYNYLYLNYHFKERKRFPVNLSFNIKSGYRKSAILNNKFIFNSQIVGMSLYKEVQLKTYPIIIKFDYNKHTSIYENISYDKIIHDNKYNIYTIKALVKLIVNTKENTTMRDVIWFGPKLDISKKDQFFGFDFGIYHPIK